MSKVFLVIVFTMMLIFAISCLATAQTYSGSLTTTDGISGGIRGTGTWWPMTISWQVYWDNDLWHYRYELTSTGKDISHFIIEVSPSFSSEDILNCSWDYSYVEIDTFTDGQGNSNPNIPGPIYGIKFDGYGPDSEYWVISFDSRRAPVWGDFYAKDGVSQGVGVNAAWNEGFLRDDPTAPPSNDTIDNHILRPDTVTEIPEPSGFLVAISCLGSYAGMMRLRRKKS